MRDGPGTSVISAWGRSDLDGPIANILVYRPRYIGDVLLTIPTLRQLRESFPAARITFLASPSVREIVDHCPYVDETLIFDRGGRHKGLAGRWRLVAELRKRKFDLALVLMRSLSSAVISYLAGARYRAGFGTEFRGPLLTHSVAYSQTTHEASCFLHVLESLGIECPPPRLDVWIPPQAHRYAENWFRARSILPTKPVLFVNPGGQADARCLHPARLAFLADRVSEEYGYQVIVIWGPGEQAAARQVIGAMRSGAELAPPTSLLQLAAFFARGTTLLTHDSGPLHLAAAVGISTVAVFGPTNPAKWNPPGDRNLYVQTATRCTSCRLQKCRYGRPCINQVDDEAVFRAFDRLWERQRLRRAA